MARLLVLRGSCRVCFPSTKQSMRALFSTTKNEGLSFLKSGVNPDNSKEVKVLENGDKLLYESPQVMSIRMMLASGFVNAAYWTYSLACSFVFKDMEASGIDLGGGNPVWTYVGLAATGMIFYATKNYSNHTIKYVYETADGQRLGFQMHNMIGLPGRKIEAKAANVKIIEQKRFGSSSLVPLRIGTLERNMVLDKDGTFFGNNRLGVLLEGKVPVTTVTTPNPAPAPATSASTHDGATAADAGANGESSGVKVEEFLDPNSKEYRTKMLKEAAGKHKGSRKKY